MNLDWGGIIASGLAGGADAANQIASADIDAKHKRELDAAHEEMIAQKQQQILAFQRQQANDMREAEVARIGAAKSGIINDIMARKYGGTDAAVAAAQGGASPDVSAAPGNENVQAALTPDQLGVINAAKGKSQAALNADPDITLQAATNTGDLDVKTLATTNASQVRAQALADARMYGSDRGVDKEEIKQKGAGDRSTARNATAEKVATIRAGANGGRLTGADRAVHDSMRAIDRDIEQESKTMRLNLAALPTAGKGKAALQAQIDASQAKIDGWRAQRNKLGTVSPEAAAAIKADDSAPAPNAGSGGVKGVSDAVTKFQSLIGGE